MSEPRSNADLRRAVPVRHPHARFVAVLAVALWTLSAGAPFAAGAVSINLDQWANKSGEWQNGNLNGNNSAYPEGGVIPFRLAIEGLKAGSHTFRINYDFTANGHKAYDFLATWNSSAAPNLCGGGGGAMSSLCPSLGARSTRAFPTDPFVANGLSVSGAQATSRVTRNLTIFGGTITSISGVRHAGSVNASSTGEMTVTFTSRGSAVLFAWGGHLAKSAYWDVSAGGALDGSAEVSGAPWHMRTLQLDNGGNRNQDRSIQSSAVYRVAEPVPPTPAPPPAAPNPPTGSTSTVPKAPSGGTAGPRLTLPASSTDAELPSGSDNGALPSLLALGLSASAFGIVARPRLVRVRR